ncbi:MAG: CYTH domain-containing protein [Bacillales bacterium]|jgi:uncharacterized protein YjbK|nr:CYTH domain-containing protein [Bacillales bacterium]
MDIEKEIEVKILVSDYDFYEVCDMLGITSETTFIIQTNNYYDTSTDFLKEKQIHLRSRVIEEQNSYQLTIKTPQKDGLIEINEKIDKKKLDYLNETGKLPLGELESFIGFIPDKLVLLASLTTHRYQFDFDGGILFLDINYYNGLQDYEIEFEGKSFEHCHWVLDNLMSELELNFEYSTVSKRQRAISSLKKI